MKTGRLQYITANPLHAEEACRGGAGWIQLRVKNKSEDEWKLLAAQAKQICQKHQATLIINDNVALAKSIAANGVHLGRQDMRPDEAREILGPGFIIGGTANTFEDIQQLAAQKVDYIGLGPFRFTQTKLNPGPLLGLQGYMDLMKRCRDEKIEVPVIAIGGIQLNDIHDLLLTGVYGIAVSSAISDSGDISKAATAFIQKIKNEGL